ncbi:MAG: DUF3455 domain-containing protein [Bryobacterales bacterium]|nr:DUF3455 domain-containing protein [Bryobacterales bacterium]
MKCTPLVTVTFSVIAFAFHSHLALGQPATAALKAPVVPENLQVPAGNALYLKTHAVGTQNYVCMPGTAGPTWKFLGPQATLFVTTPWVRGEIRWQVATHFLSSNPAEGGTARPTWQSSFDTSTVWGKAIADSNDPRYVAAGSIPWLLVQAAGYQAGTGGGSALSQTTFIQRVNTSGGVAPSTGCDESAYGKVALVPYTTDYFLYQAHGRR